MSETQRAYANRAEEELMESIVIEKGAARKGPSQQLDEGYVRLVQDFPLESIRDTAHLKAALAVLDRLLDQGPLPEGEEAYLHALTDLVETYETAHVELPLASGRAVLRYLMEVNGLNQNDLIPEMGTASIVSEVLAGKRGFSMSHVKKLSARFGVPADVFLG